MLKISLTIDENTFKKFKHMVKEEGYTISSRVNVLMDQDFKKWEQKTEFKRSYDPILVRR
jgi:hypothetical protein